ncbi:hypothetical protein [Desulfogranum japonicum]|uniref:hypothetical protein n=1 Tax=Desulfogranum japonicum TaxID=231447 RepID=UPI00042436EC|nr:hypothetical protein [Desulfogranum japonicum]
MGAPTVYKWTDTGAPRLTGGIAGGLATLQACLVTGYGGKPAAGWSMPFEDLANGVAVFRNAGSGAFLRVTHDLSAMRYSGRSMAFEAFEAMTDINTGTERMPLTASEYSYIQVSDYATNTYAYPWVIIADDKSFYFFAWYQDEDLAEIPAGSFAAKAMFCGDVIPADSSDAYTFAIIGQGSGSGQTFLGAFSTFNVATATGHHIQRNMAGDPGAINFTVIQPALAYYAFGGGSVGYQLLPYPFNGQVYLNPTLINNGVGYTFRGQLPGCYHPSHNAANVEDSLTEVALDGTTYMTIKFYGAGSSRPCCVFIDLGQNFRP